MTAPATGPAEFGSAESGIGSAAADGHGDAPVREAIAVEDVEHGGRGLPGGRVVLVASLAVIGVAVLEVALRDRIGPWTGVTLIAVSALAVLVTRAGDRSLPAMMPPLAFLVAVAIAGQQLLSPAIDDPLQRQAVMIVQTLGQNAAWVVAATAVAVTLALVGHLLTRRSRRQAASTTGAVVAH